MTKKELKCYMQMVIFSPGNVWITSYNCTLYYSIVSKAQLGPVTLA